MGSRSLLFVHDLRVLRRSFEQKHLSVSFVKMTTLELRYIKVNASSSASAVELVKIRAISHLQFDLRDRQPARAAIFMSCDAKSWKFKRASLQKEEPCRGKTL